MEILSDSVFKGQVRFNKPVDFDESEFHGGQAFFNSSTQISNLHVDSVSSKYGTIYFNDPETHCCEVVIEDKTTISGPLEVGGSEVHGGPGPVLFQSSGYDFEINNMNFSVKNGSADLLGNKFTANGIKSLTDVWSITHGSYTNTFPQKSGTLATVDDIPTVGLKVYRQQLEIDASTIPENCTAFRFGSYSPLTEHSITGSGDDSPRKSIVSTQAYLISPNLSTPFTYPAIEIELVCGSVIGKKASGLSLEGTLGVNMLAVI